MTPATLLTVKRKFCRARLREDQSSDFTLLRHLAAASSLMKICLCEMASARLQREGRKIGAVSGTSHMRKRSRISLGLPGAIFTYAQTGDAKMRIAQVAPLTEAVPPKLYGGTERVVHWLTEELVALGHDVTLFASGDSRTSAKLDATWPKALRLDGSVRDPNALHMVMLERVRQKCDDEEFDFLHFHLDYYPFSLFYRQPTPFLTTLHGRLDLPEHQPVFNTFSKVPVISISKLVLVIFWFYFLVPYIGQWLTGASRPIRVGAFASTLVTFIMFEATYFSEIMRAGIQSISKGQPAAASALGLTYSQSMRYIVLPQAFRNMLPVLLTQTIVLFQDTSLVYVLSIPDFLGAASKVAQRDGRLVEMYLFAAAVYFVISCFASWGVRLLQARIAIVR